MTLFWVALGFAVYLGVCYVLTGVAGFNNYRNEDGKTTSN